MSVLKIGYSSKDALGLLSIFVVALCAQASATPLREGIVIDLGGRSATLKSLDTLPYVESEYTRRFTFDSYENPKLAELRTRYKLAEAVAAGRDGFERQVLLMDWAHQQFKKFGRPSAPARGALEILKAIDDTFIWTDHPGQNRVEVRTLNKFGVAGPISSAVLDVGK